MAHVTLHGTRPVGSLAHNHNQSLSNEGSGVTKRGAIASTPPDADLIVIIAIKPSESIECVLITETPRRARYSKAFEYPMGFGGGGGG